MITKEQTRSLATFFQIDEFTIMREYLQILFLGYLYREREADKVYFKGGTALRLLFSSPRFSEDLDFSTTLTKKKVASLLKEIEKSLEKELTNIKISLLYSGKNGARYRLKYQPEGSKYPLNLRLDFIKVSGKQKAETTPLLTKFPIASFPLVIHLSKEAIFLEKTTAFLTRGKGRDVFDLWFLLKKYESLKSQIVKEGKKRKAIIKKLSLYPERNLKNDLVKFLPRSQREVIGKLKEIVITELTN